MSTRIAEEAKLTVPSGRRYSVTLIKNPNIDDIVISEMKVQAQSIAEDTPIGERRVSRDIRDFLVRLGVER